MFSIETTEDIKILRELTNDTRIKELELELQQLTQVNETLLETTKQQKQTITELKESLITADQCRDIVFDLMSNASKPEIIKQKVKKAPKTRIETEKQEFKFTDAMKRKFNKIIVNGNKLTHLTVRNQKMEVPITTLELLALGEVYQKRHRKLLNKDQKNFCKLYNINKVQFGKIYYNLKEGIFFKTLNEIDNQVKRTNFKLKNGTIHIIEGANSIDTKIDSRMFNQLLNIYINSNQPYSTIYKISREKTNLNPIHILTVLKKNKAVSQIIMNG